MRNAGLEEAQAGIKIARRNINNLRYADDTMVAQMVRRLPAMWETRVRFLGQKDLLEKEMAIHSSTLAWKIPWTKGPGGLWSMGFQRVRHDLAIKSEKKWEPTPVF